MQDSQGKRLHGALDVAEQMEHDLHGLCSIVLGLCELPQSTQVDGDALFVIVSEIDKQAQRARRVGEIIAGELGSVHVVGATIQPGH